MRSVPEWRGRTDDSPIPPRVRLRVWERGIGHCEECGRKIMAGETWEVDHRIALILGGPHAEGNMRVVCLWCHRSKSRMEQARKAKADVVAKRHVGIRKRRSFRVWRRFDGTIVHADD
jgi:5-methylcytosine-specific restriction protein A